VLFVAATLVPAAFCPSHLTKTFEIGSVLNTPKKMIIFLDLKIAMFYNIGIT